VKRFGDPSDTPSKDAFKIMQIKKKQWSKSENNVGVGREMERFPLS
jgi:hypothetical protein